MNTSITPPRILDELSGAGIFPEALWMLMGEALLLGPHDFGFLIVLTDQLSLLLIRFPL